MGFDRTDCTIRKARLPDVPAIYQLINSFARTGAMLPRSLSALYENVRDFYVVEDGGLVVGCCALHVTWEDLAEVKSLAVDEQAQGRGCGRALLEACLAEAREMGVPKVFALTYIPEFFEKAGFRRVDKAALPHKVWSECISCPKFPDCGEEAVIIEL